MRIKGNGSVVAREKKPRNKCRKWELSVSTDRGKKTRQYKGTYTRARQGLEDFKRELEGVTGESPTFAEYAGKWHERREKSSLAHNTMVNEKSRLRRLCAYLGAMKLEDVEPGHIERCIQEQRDAGLSETSLSMYFITLHSIFEDAVKRKVIASNPCDFADRPRRDSKEKRVMSDMEMDALMHRLDLSDYHQRGIMLICACGLRRNEAVGVRWGDVSDVVSVRRADDNTGHMKPPKTAAGIRDVPLPEWVARALEPYRDGNEYAASPGYGMVLRGDELGRWWKTHRESLGCELNLHEIRHSYLTRLARAGVHPRIMQRLAGHSTLDVTLEIYTHVSHDMERDAVRAAFGGTEPGLRAGNERGVIRFPSSKAV